MTMLAMSKHTGHHHPKYAMAQVGWLGQTGKVYALDDAPYDSREKGGFTPLYITLGEECKHTIEAEES